MIKFAPRTGKSVILKESDNTWYTTGTLKNKIPIKRKRAIKKRKSKYRENINCIKIKKKRRNFFYILFLLLLLLFFNYRRQL